MEENAPRQIKKREQLSLSRGGRESEHKQACLLLADSFLFYLPLILSIYSYYV